MASRRKGYDWELIEREYRAGVLSIREIAKQHGCSDAAIRKKAKQNGWERDLSAKVAEKVRNEVVRKQVRTQDPLTEKEIVEQAAATQVEVVRSHQKRIKNTTDTVDKLLVTLSRSAANKNKEEADKALSRDSAVAVNLTNSLQRLIAMERQAFGMDDQESGKKSASTLTEILAEIDGKTKGLPNG